MENYSYLGLNKLVNNKRDIDEELNKLIEIKRQVMEFNNLMKNTDIILISRCSYDSLPDKVLSSNLLFYIIPYEIEDYVKEDEIILSEDNKVFIIRNGECINTIQL